MEVKDTLDALGQERRRCEQQLATLMQECAQYVQTIDTLSKESAEYEAVHTGPVL